MSFRHQWHEEMYTVHKYWYWKCILPQVLLSCSWLSDCFPLSQVLTFAKFVPFFLAFLVMVARNCSRKSARPAALLQQGNIPKLDDPCAGSFVNLFVDGLKGSGVILLFLLWICESTCFMNLDVHDPWELDVPQLLGAARHFETSRVGQARSGFEGGGQAVQLLSASLAVAL